MELPVAWANYLSIAGFLLLAIGVWMIPQRLILQEAPNRARWRDIRLWASVLIVLQLGLYAVFT